MNRLAAAGALTLLFPLLGCGDGGSGTTVSGTITFKGSPPSTGLIAFVESGRPPQSAPIQAGGAYRVNLPKGDYQVRIDTPPALPEGWQEGQPIPKLAPRVVPEQYSNFATSGLTASITGEPSQALDFKLP